MIWVYVFWSPSFGRRQFVAVFSVPRLVVASHVVAGLFGASHIVAGLFGACHLGAVICIKTESSNIIFQFSQIIFCVTCMTPRHINPACDRFRIEAAITWAVWSWVLIERLRKTVIACITSIFDASPGWVCSLIRLTTVPSLMWIRALHTPLASHL